jgi:hypothetical protein
LADVLQTSIEKQLGSVFEPHFPTDFTASVGIKSWLNKWDLPVVLDNNQIVSYNSETEATLIPMIGFRYKNFLISGSYFPQSEYSFGAQTIDFPLTSPNDGRLTYIDSNLGAAVGVSGGASVKVPVPSAISAERSEWDINVGYYLHRSLLVSAGYKRVDRQFRLHGQLPDDFALTMFDPTGNELGTVGIDEMKQAGMDTTFQFDEEAITDGLTLNITSVVPLQGAFGLYGNFGFGWLETKGKAEPYDTDYYLGEFGLLYSHGFSGIPALNAAAVYLGYRFQFLNDDLGIGNGATDSTEGFVLGVNLVF